MEETLKTELEFGKMDMVEGIPYLEMRLRPSKQWSFITIAGDRLVITDNLVTQPNIDTLDVRISDSLLNVANSERQSLIRAMITELIIQHIIRFRPRHSINLDWDLLGVSSDGYAEFIKAVIDAKGKEKGVPKKVYLKYGELTFAEKYGNCPVLEIRTRIGSDGPEETFGYVTPFRGYYFQISQTYEGQLDLANYSAIHGTMINCFDSCTRAQKEDIYRMMLYSTFLNCLTNAYGSDYHPSSSLMQEWREDSPIKEFINKSIDWVETYIKRK